MKKSGKTGKDYRRLMAYDVIKINGNSHLISKKRKESNTLMLYTSIESMFDILDKCHRYLGHRRTLSKFFLFQYEYKNIWPLHFEKLSTKYAKISREVVDIFQQTVSAMPVKKEIPPQRHFWTSMTGQ